VFMPYMLTGSGRTVLDFVRETGVLPDEVYLRLEGPKEGSR
jgi:hypothetical protein